MGVVTRRASGRRGPVVWVAVAAMAVSGAVRTAHAFDAPTIVEVRFSAAPSQDTEDLERLFGLRAGDPYRPLEIRKAVRRLYQLGRYENVFVRAADTAEGVRLLVELPPRRVVRALVLDDRSVLDEGEVLSALQVQVGDPFDVRKLADWEDALERYLVRRGYRAPAVGLAYWDADEEGGVDVQVRIEEGPLTRLGRFLIQGRTRRPLWQIGEVVTIGSGDVLQMRGVERSVEALQRDYRERGYLDAKVRLVEIRDPLRPGPRPRADVVLKIEAGPRVSIEFSGNRAVSTRALEEDAEVLRELGTGVAALAEVRERMVSRYERRGYWRVKVAPETRQSPRGDRKRVRFFIREGQPALVRNLTFPGYDERFEASRLEDTVVQLVRDALGDADGQPGANPRAVDAIIGGVSGPGARQQPDTSAPDPRRVYIPRAYRAAQEAIADLYRTEGYQTVEVRSPILAAVPGQDMVDVAIPVRPGVQWRIGRVSFAGNRLLTDRALRALSGLGAGAAPPPLAFDDVEEARRKILEHYRNLGHLYVRIVDELRLLDVGPDGPAVETSSVASAIVREACTAAEAAGEETCDVELLYRIAEGPRVITEDVIVRGVEKTWPSIVRNEIEVRRDEVLSADAMEQTRDNLLRLGLFDLVEVRPLDEGQGSNRKDVLVKVKERDPYWLELGVGASTEDGLRGSVGFGDGNLFGSALRLQLLGRLNVWLPSLLVLYNEEIRRDIESFYNDFDTLERLEYEVAAGLSYPRIPLLPRGFSAGLDLIVLRDFDPAFLENTQTITLLTTYKDDKARLAGRRPPSFQLRANVGRTDLECNPSLQSRDPNDPNNCTTDPNVRNPDPSFRGTNFYLSTGPRIIWDLRDDSLDPKRGAYFELETFYEVGLDDISPNYVNVNGRANFYVPMAPRVVLALSVLGGRLIQVSRQDQEIPLNRRLFAGGRTTVRGYAEQTLIPQDSAVDAAISTGGRIRAALKSELRIFLFPALALSLFYDVGDLWQGDRLRLETKLELPDGTRITRGMAQGAGVGLRVSTPIGPLAIDLAVPVNPRDPAPSTAQLHFAVGSF